MSFLERAVKASLGLALALIFCVSLAQAQQTGSLRGQIADEFGGVIVGATVTITDATGAERTATTNEEGIFSIANLVAGTYSVRATAEGFALYENPAVTITAGQPQALNITLGVMIEAEEVLVASEAPVSTEPENNAGAIVLRGEDLEALPDDPDDLAEALQALAGPAAGPSGGQIFIDGFTGGRLPPRESIREIRINQNPFSAEFDRLGFGRIEILTRPGTDTWRGSAFLNFNDESLNSRNPFAPERAPYQLRFYGGNISGPVIARRASFFMDFTRREEDDNDIIRATILNSALQPTPFALAVLTPARRTSISPRFDFHINPNHTLVARYSYTSSERLRSGIGDFNLLSRAFDTTTNEHTFQLTETAIINQRTINETRFQYVRRHREQIGDQNIPTVRVLDAFTGGGAQVGQSFNNESRWELANNTSLALGAHAIKFGGRVRGIRITDFAPNNYTGTFTFAGGLAPQLDANNQVVLGANGQPVLVPITSIERYRRTILFQQQGLTAAQVRTLGGGPTQFQIAGGNPEATVSQWDFGGYIQDDWRVRPNFTLSMGLRYENQSNISSNLNFAPRISFAWSPGAGAGAAGAGPFRQPQTVIRGGFGIFYERFGESLVLQANRFNGINQQQFLVTDPNVLGLAQFTVDGVTNVPTIQQFEGFALPQITRSLAGDLQAPYTIQSSLSFERQLPYSMTFSATFINTRTLHLLRTRNINAPLPGTVVAGVPGSGVRPLAGQGDIYQYESSGILNQNQLILGLNSRFSRNLSFFARYMLGKASSDTDGAGSFPANQYDLSQEYGRSSFDVRHRFIVSGSYSAPWGIRLNPFIIASSGRPFNITTGRDTNGDGLFTDRPSFATGADCANPGPNIVCTRYGNFNLNPAPGEQLIPRNYGEGPAFFSVNMRISRTFGFGAVPGRVAGGTTPGEGGGPGAGGPGGMRGGRGGGGGGRGGRGGGGGGRGGGGGFGDGGGESRYNLTLSLQISNLLNTTNLGQPVGNLSSPLFGQSISTAGGFGFGPGGGGGNPAAGNRRIEAQIRFSF